MKPPKILDDKLKDYVMDIKDSLDYLSDDIDEFCKKATGENRKFINEDIDILRKELYELRRSINNLYIPKNLI